MFSLLPTADNCSMTVVLVWVGRVGREWHQPSASTEHWSSVSTRACWTSLRMTSSSEWVCRSVRCGWRGWCIVCVCVVVGDLLMSFMAYLSL